MLINLSSVQSANLKTILRYMNQQATKHDLGADEDAMTDGSRVSDDVGSWDNEIADVHVDHSTAQLRSSDPLRSRSG